ncbi:hypothetical protein AB7188_00150 [Providencia rettgeri]|uniref:hypothetical protein n=1 Tax=Providencia stuartii TaxID=588 RepID=UPI002AB8A5AB|nr:hypothetical protein [Providencia rettgeri]
MMKTDKLNKRELKYLAPAVLFNRCIHKNPYHKNGYWDRRSSRPVSIGVISEKLISLGYLEKIYTYGEGEGVAGFYYLIATQKAMSLECKKCVDGRMLNDEFCPACHGIGLVMEQES